MNTFTEENYLKAIFKYSVKNKEGVSTNVIADELNTNFLMIRRPPRSTPALLAVWGFRLGFCTAL